MLGTGGKWELVQPVGRLCSEQGEMTKVTGNGALDVKQKVMWVGTPSDLEST